MSFLPEGAPTLSKSSSRANIPPPPPPRPPPPPPSRIILKDLEPLNKKQMQKLEILKSRPRKRPDWACMMKEVESGKTLRHVKCNDRSAPLIERVNKVKADPAGDPRTLFFPLWAPIELKFSSLNRQTVDSFLFSVSTLLSLAYNGVVKSWERSQSQEIGHSQSNIRRNNRLWLINFLRLRPVPRLHEPIADHQALLSVTLLFSRQTDSRYPQPPAIV